jgi:drug/metabolite transporter (DMT)-like permease
VQTAFLMASAIVLFTFQNVSFKQFNRLFMTGAASYFLFSALYFAVISGVFASFGADLAVFTPRLVFVSVLFAASFICAILFYVKALEHGPLGLSFMFFSAGILWPILYGILVFHEPAPPHKAAGLVLLFAALYISTRGGDSAEQGGKISRKWIVYILLASFGNGILGITLLLFRTAAPPEAITDFLFLSFGLAAMTSCGLWLVLRRKDTAGLARFRSWTFVFVVLGAAFTTAFGNYIMVRLALLISALVQFPVINGTLVITSLLASRVIFKERLTRRHLQAIGAGLAAIVILSL